MTGTASYEDASLGFDGSAFSIPEAAIEAVRAQIRTDLPFSVPLAASPRLGFRVRLRLIWWAARYRLAHAIYPFDEVGNEW